MVWHGSARLVLIVTLCVVMTGLAIVVIVETRGTRNEQGDVVSLDVDPTSPDAEDAEAALRAAQAYLDTGDVPKAEAILSLLVVRAPRSVQARELLGRTLVRKASELTRQGAVAAAAAANADAYAQYRMASDLDRDSPGLQHAAGVVAATAGLDEAALRHFRTAADLDRSSAQYPLYAAQILIRQGAHDAAADALDRAVRLDPDEPLAHASLCHLAIALEQLDAALAHVQEARAIAPGDLRFRVLEAKVHRRRGQPQRALELLAALSRPERLNEAVSDESARSHAALGDHAAAAAVWIERFNEGPKDIATWRSAVRAGEALRLAGQTTAAREWLDRARLLAGDVPEVTALEAALDGQ